jgi:hypothetical protein
VWDYVTYPEDIRRAKNENGPLGKHNPPPSPPGKGARGADAAANETSTP